MNEYYTISKLKVKVSNLRATLGIAKTSLNRVLQR